MELRKINTQDSYAQWEYTTVLPADENGLTNPYNGISYKEYIDKALPTLISYEHPIDMPDWFVPETYYYLWDGDCLVGEFRIRHHLTEALGIGAGHIGYSIRKEIILFSDFNSTPKAFILNGGAFGIIVISQLSVQLA